MLDSSLIEGGLSLYPTKIQADEKPRKVGAGETANKANIKLFGLRIAKAMQTLFLAPDSKIGL